MNTNRLMLAKNLMMGEPNLMMEMCNLMMRKIIARLLVTANVIYVYMCVCVIIHLEIRRICRFLARFSHFLGSGVTLYLCR